MNNSVGVGGERVDELEENLKTVVILSFFSYVLEIGLHFGSKETDKYRYLSRIYREIQSFFEPK